MCATRKGDAPQPSWFPQLMKTRSGSHTSVWTKAARKPVGSSYSWISPLWLKINMPPRRQSFRISGPNLMLSKWTGGRGGHLRALPPSTAFWADHPKRLAGRSSITADKAAVPRYKPFAQSARLLPSEREAAQVDFSKKSGSGVALCSSSAALAKTGPTPHKAYQTVLCQFVSNLAELRQSRPVLSLQQYSPWHWRRSLERKSSRRHPWWSPTGFRSCCNWTRKVETSRPLPLFPPLR